MLSDYPARGGRAGFAVGLDTPASVARILDCLAGEGYDAPRTFDDAELMPALTREKATFAVPLALYEAWLATLPAGLREELDAACGAPEADPLLRAGAFRFARPARRNILVALQPDRGRGGDRKARYHDPTLPPSHAYLAFYCGLREGEGVDALIHLGTHGTTEWLPGKAVALSERCWPRLAVGALPVVYPFIVDDPGEAAPAKRRLPAIALGHLTPAVVESGLDGRASAPARTRRGNSLGPRARSAPRRSRRRRDPRARRRERPRRALRHRFRHADGARADGASTPISAISPR